MPTTRQYTLDIDTKRYLNRVNTYRSLSGIPAITDTDAVDIDNFVIGLKDLGIWHNSICFLMRGQHNVGAGTTINSIGGQSNINGTLVNSPTWSLSGITFSGTNHITALLGRTIQTSEVSIASVCNSAGPQAGFTNGFNYQLSISTNSYSVNGFSFVSQGSNGSSWIIEGNQSSSAASTTSINNQTNRFQGGRLFSGGTQNYLNGSTTTSATVRNNQIFDRIQICGRWNEGATPQCTLGNYGVGFVGTQSFVIVSLDYVDFVSLQRLVKETIGKGLGLP
jgi:hypothetical protein